MSGKRPIVWVQLDCAPEMLDRLGSLRAGRPDDRHHVVRAVAARLLLDGALHVAERRLGIAGAQGHGCRVHPFGRRLGTGGPLGCFAFADAQIQSGPLDQLAFLRVSLEHLPKGLGGARVVVALQAPDATLVDRDRLVKTGLFRGAGGGGGVGSTAASFGAAFTVGLATAFAEGLATDLTAGLTAGFAARAGRRAGFGLFEFVDLFEIFEGLPFADDAEALAFARVVAPPAFEAALAVRAGALAAWLAAVRRFGMLFPGVTSG